jgi:hypothetical protein
MKKNYLISIVINIVSIAIMFYLMSRSSGEFGFIGTMSLTGVFLSAYFVAVVIHLVVEKELFAKSLLSSLDFISLPIGISLMSTDFQGVVYSLVVYASMVVFSTIISMLIDFMINKFGNKK